MIKSAFVAPGRYLWQLCLAISLFFASSIALAQNQTDLESVQNEIKNKQSNLQAKVKTAETLQAQLKKAELEISALTKATIISTQQLRQLKQEQTALKSKHSRLERQKENQQKLLADQIKSAYTAGDHDYAKLLLSQENAGKFERMLVYYQYLNKARLKQIDSFTALMVEIEQTVTSLEKKAAEIAQVQAQQQQQQQSLLSQQKSRETTLKTLQANISTDAAQIEQLQINEQQLANAIFEAIERERAKQQMVLSGLEKARGKLMKPVNGRYRKLFGKRRQGQVRWKGDMFESPTGRPVSAVHQGKVLFADWLKGLGLVIVLDHGEGYMSLYGHNQALLKQAGEVVEPGETIALVGESGGQRRPGLYFELRHRGEAINPGRWLKI